MSNEQTENKIQQARKCWLAGQARDALLQIKPTFKGSGEYYLTAYYVSGQLPFIRESVVSLVQAVSRADSDFSRGTTKIRLGEALGAQHSLYPRNYNNFYDSTIHDGLKLVLSGAENKKDVDELALPLNIVCSETRHYLLLKQAREDAQKARDLMVRYFGKEGAEDLRRDHCWHERDLVLHRAIWRLTRRGINFSALYGKN